MKVKNMLRVFGIGSVDTILGELFLKVVLFFTAVKKRRG